MAKASYIYIVSAAQGPLAAFGMKRDLVKWITQHSPLRSDAHIFRVAVYPWLGTNSVVDVTEGVLEVLERDV